MDRCKPQRPRTIGAMRAAMARLRTPEGERYARAFVPRPDDILIATYPKSGTTWMQQIVHGLRTGGSMAFDEITEVVPWIEMAHDLGHDLAVDHAATPRAFKTHYDWNGVPKGGRYIYIMRDPKDVAVSFYRFFEGWFFERGSISLSAFVRDFFAPGTRSGRYWDHLASWWEQRAQPDTLFLCYEDMVADLPGTVDRVAGLVGVAPGSPAVQIAARQATLEFMQRHNRQFDDHLVRDARDAACGLPPGSTTTKVRTVHGDAGRLGLTPDLAAYLDAIWETEMTPRFGYANYGEMRAALSTQ